MTYIAIAKPISSFIMFTVWMLLLTDFRYDKKKTASLVILSEMMMIAINIALVALLSYEIYLKYYIPIIYLSVIPLIFLISKNRDYRDIFTVTISVFFSGCVCIPATLVASMFDNNALIELAARAILAVPLCFALIKYIRPGFLQFRESLPRGWAIFSMLPMIGIGISMIFITRHMMEGGDMYSISLGLLCAVGIIMFVTTIYIIYYYFVARTRDRMLSSERDRLVSQQDKYWEQVIEKQEDHFEQASRYRHDMRHHCTVVAELIRDGKNSEAIKYLEDLGAKVSASKPKLICENRAVNCILDVYGEKAKEMGIDMRFDANVPEGLSLSGIELAGLFANSVENAMEACEKLPGNSEKYIAVTSFWHCGKLRIKVENPCGDVSFSGDLPVSSKEHGGIGTSSIAQTVKNHGGIVSFTAKNGIFTFAAVIPAEISETVK